MAGQGQRSSATDFGLGALRGRPAGAGQRSHRVRHGTARVRLPLHLLHRSLHARPRAEPAAGRRRARGRAARRARHERGHAARPDREHLSRRRARLRRPAARGGRGRGIRRVRFTSPYPTDFTPRVIDAMATTPAVCEHVHLPVQSGSDAVLRRMLRRYTRERYLEVVGELRAAIPGITLSTDIIVGFPGETDAQFEETLSLVADAEFDDAYTFKYSPRDGTPAVRLKDHVPDEVASERLERLIEAVRAQTRRRNVARVGQTHEVLVERPARRGDLMLAALGPTSSCCSICPRARWASITGADSPALPDPPSPGRSSRPRWRFCDPQHDRGARSGRLRLAAPTFPGFLRVRHVPGRCAGVHAQPGAGAVRRRGPGLGADRVLPRKGSEPGGHRRGDDGGAAEDRTRPRCGAASRAPADLSRGPRR